MLVRGVVEVNGNPVEVTTAKKKENIILFLYQNVGSECNWDLQSELDNVCIHLAKFPIIENKGNGASVHDIKSLNAMDPVRWIHCMVFYALLVGIEDGWCPH